MSTTSITIFDPVAGTNAPVLLGNTVASGIKRKFTKGTVYNSTAAVVPIKMYLVPKAQAASTTNCYVDYDLQPRETYNCPEIIGAALGEGGQLMVTGVGASFSAVATDITEN